MDVLGLLRVELAPDLVEVQLSRQVVYLLGLDLHIVDVLGRTLDYLVLACGSSMGTFVVGEDLLPDFGGLRVGVVHHFLEALFRGQIFEDGLNGGRSFGEIFLEGDRGNGKGVEDLLELGLGPANIICNLLDRLDLLRLPLLLVHAAI